MRRRHQAPANPQGCSPQSPKRKEEAWLVSTIFDPAAAPPAPFLQSPLPALGLGTVAVGSGGSVVSSCLARGISTPEFGCDREKMVAGLTMVIFFLFSTTQGTVMGSQGAVPEVRPTGSLPVGAPGIATAGSEGLLWVVGAVHGVTYLSPSPQKHSSYHQIHWRRNDVVKIASRDSEGKVQYPNRNYKGRLELFPNNTLKISYLQKNDSSTYQVYLEDKGGKEDMENIQLMVYDLVPKPTVKAKVISDDPEHCKAMLECLVELEEVTYEWIPPSKLLLDAMGASEQFVSFDPSVETYTCKVSNPVSSNNASLTYRHPCSWTGESPSAASFTTTSVLVALGQPLLLVFLLALA
ncbi:LOW QUALITY PROTEIN: SLAM family member 8-like [Aegotheles albertisi]